MEIYATEFEKRRFASRVVIIKRVDKNDNLNQQRGEKYFEFGGYKPAKSVFFTRFYNTR